MSEKTNIEWTDHTGGPWLGCSIVSPGCQHCYSKALAESRLDSIFRRAYKSAGFDDWATRPVWGPKATRVLSKGFWKDALAINARHAKAGTRGKWFMSMIDLLDDMPAGIIDQDGHRLEPVAVRARLLRLMYYTPNLTWLNLTKRPEKWLNLLTECYSLGRFDPSVQVFSAWLYRWLHGEAPNGIWIGASVEDQHRADERIPELLKIPVAVRFLSAEPLLGPVNLKLNCPKCGYSAKDASAQMDHSLCGEVQPPRIDWCIVGGESGPGARPCDVEWIRDIVRQCDAAGVKPFVKQMGSYLASCRKVNLPNVLLGDPTACQTVHSKGGDPSEWPEDLRRREFPEVGR